MRTFLFILASLLAAATLHAAQVTVFAAASLTDALRQIAAEYEKSSTDKIVFNFAASGILARQIEAGAPADIFFSADEAQLDKVANQGLLSPGSRRNLLGNSLVIITPPDTTITIAAPTDLTNAAVKRIALGDPKIVPAGTYARSYLEKSGCWTLVESRVIPCENVRAVLAVVESGNAEAGIVYKSDAAIAKKARVAFEVPLPDGPRITYPAALIKGSGQPEAAARFMNCLASDASARVFRQYGFMPLTPAKP